MKKLTDECKPLAAGAQAAVAAAARGGTPLEQARTKVTQAKAGLVEMQLAVHAAEQELAEAELQAACIVTRRHRHEPQSAGTGTSLNQRHMYR
jgi:hypothetical protein